LDVREAVRDVDQRPHMGSAIPAATYQIHAPAVRRIQANGPTGNCGGGTVG